MTPAAPPTQAPAKVNITIDGKPYAVKAGITLIEAIDQAQIPLPRYCYHPGLSIAGNCRICQVEVEKMPRTVIACNIRVAEGMVIRTNSPKAQESQKVVLEFLLANHPLDCPVCDQSGECKLQDYYMEFGAYDPRFNENKVKKTKKAFSIGPTIMLDQERCILCSRCVRFTDEITRTHEFGIFNRADRAEVDVYPGKPLDNKYSGNVADICPVGALTDKDFRFKMRVWYLGSRPSVCPGCSRGCNINVEFEQSRPYHLKSERVMRLKPRENPFVNQWWMCDEGRYGYKPIDKDRVTRPRLRRSGALRESSWDEVWPLVAAHLKRSKTDPSRWALLSSGQYTNEELYLQRKVFKEMLGWTQFGFRSRFDLGGEDSFLIRPDKNPNTTAAVRLFQLTGEDDVRPILDKARSGGLDGLFIATRDLGPYGEELLRAAREKVGTIIAAVPNENAGARIADIVLPAAVYAEKEGTFTNFEGRVQRIRKVLEPLGESRPSWKILSDKIVELGGKPYAKPEDIFNELARTESAFAGMTYATIEPYGQIWKPQ